MSAVVERVWKVLTHRALDGRVATRDGWRLHGCSGSKCHRNISGAPTDERPVCAVRSRRDHAGRAMLPRSHAVRPCSTPPGSAAVLSLVPPSVSRGRAPSLRRSAHGLPSLLQITDSSEASPSSRARPRALQRLAEAARRKRYTEGSVIVFADDPALALLVRAGRVRCALATRREVTLGVPASARTSESSASSRQPRSATHRARDSVPSCSGATSSAGERGSPAVAWALLMELCAASHRRPEIGGLGCRRAGRIARV